MENPSAGKTALGLDTNIGAMICYLGNIICGIGGLVYSIIVVTSDKVNPLPRFHAFQSIFLSVASVIIFLPGYLIMFAGAFIDMAIGLPLVSGLVGLVLCVLALAILVFWIMAAVKAYGGQMYKIPVIGNFAEKYAG